MAKDTRKINRTVRRSEIRLINESTGELSSVPTTYGPDMADELAAVLTPDEGERLLSLNVIEGDWKFTGGAADNSAAQSKAADDSKAADAKADKK